MATMRVFEVPGPGEPPSQELESVTITAEGDEAKRAARTMLEGEGWAVRALNWGPGPGGGKPVLIAYVTKKGAA